MTVLELLELQARARAIRAQLNVEKHVGEEQEGGQKNNESNSDEDDVLIKEEPAEVVELSSDEDQKPDITKLNQETGVKQTGSETVSTKEENDKDNSQIVAHRNNLTIILPKAPTTRKIKLKRKTNLTNHLQENNTTTNTECSQNQTKVSENQNEKCITDKCENSTESKKDGECSNAEVNSMESKLNTNKTKIEVSKEPENSELSINTIPPTCNDVDSLESTSLDINYDTRIDNEDRDEITLQISDSEQLDLLKGCENDLVDSHKKNRKTSHGKIKK